MEDEENPYLEQEKLSYGANLVVFNNDQPPIYEFMKRPVQPVDVEDPSWQLTREDLAFD